MEREFMISGFHFPPGFRFHPSDQELIKYYLVNKVTASQLPADVIAETDLYNYNPWDLPEKAKFGEDEWYFFSPRYRKYPNGTRPNRKAASGFWKATGPDKDIFTSSGTRKIGVKKALAFYTGRPPRGLKTEWVMHEYRLPDPVTRPAKLRGSMRLDNWVLCRIRQKGNMSKNTPESQGGPGGSVSPCQLAKELPSAHTNAIDNTTLINDALFKEFPFVALILSGQDLPPIKDISSTTTFSSTNNSNICGSILEEDSSRANTTVTSSMFDSFFNGNQEINGTSCFFDQSQSQGNNIFNPVLPDGVMNIQDVNDNGFSGGFLQY